MFKPASYLENREVRVLPAALIGIHFHFPVVLNVKNRAHAKCFEFAEEGLGPQVGSVESILLYYEQMGQPVTRRSVAGCYYPERKKRNGRYTASDLIQGPLRT